MNYYKHTQFGTLILAVLLVTLIVAVVIMVEVGPHPTVLAVLGVLGLITVLFSAITVQVGADAVRIRFGPGPIRKSFAVSEIRGVRAVRNHWTYGWGIRLTPHGWLFNVSGMDAVELTMSDGKLYRIGTDQPRELVTAIVQAGGGAIAAAEQTGGQPVRE